MGSNRHKGADASTPTTSKGPTSDGTEQRRRPTALRIKRASQKEVVQRNCDSLEVDLQVKTVKARERREGSYLYSLGVFIPPNRPTTTYNPIGGAGEGAENKYRDYLPPLPDFQLDL
jgi:hypothetical protein